MTTQFASSDIPADLVRRLTDRPADHGLDGNTWLARLPNIVADLVDAWDLTVAGTPMNGHNALVLPVERHGRLHMLKVSWPHREADYEHIGLRHWGGDGIVELVAADPGRYALLLEALDVGHDLHGVDIEQACEVIGDLLGRLHVPAPARVPRFHDVVGAWLEPLRRHPDTVPRRYVDQALEVFGHLKFTPRLLHLDLHFGNVLRADREPWLAIDPKPLSGPPGFDVYPAIRNRVEEYVSGAQMRWQVQHRVEIVADAAGIELDQARDWSLVHAVLNAHETAEEGWPTLVTLHLSIVKVLAEAW